MKKKRSFAFVLILILMNALSSMSQSNSNHEKNLTFSLEIGGRGFYGALFLERKFMITQKLNIVPILGISMGRFNDATRKFNPEIIIPISVQLIKPQKHSPELGLGVSFSSIPEINSKKRRHYATLIPYLGYRYHSASNPFNFRVFYSPFLIDKKNLWHWGGVAIGYDF